MSEKTEIKTLVVAVMPNHPSGQRNRAGFTFTTQPTVYEVKAEQEKLKAERDLQRIEVEAKQKVASAKAEADALVARAQAAGFTAFEQRVPTDNGVLWRVRLGPAAERGAAEQMKTDAASKLGVSGIVVPHP